MIVIITQKGKGGVSVVWRLQVFWRIGSIIRVVTCNMTRNELLQHSMDDCNRSCPQAQRRPDPPAIYPIDRLGW